MTGPEGEKANAHSSDPGQNNAVEASHQAATNARASDLTANPDQAANTPQLAGSEAAHDFIGFSPARPKRPCPHFKSIVPDPKVWVSETQEKLAAETLQERHKSDLDGGILSGAGRALRPCYGLCTQVLTWKWR